MLDVPVVLRMAFTGPCFSALAGAEGISFRRLLLVSYSGGGEGGYFQISCAEFEKLF